ncbi:hypothetical protein HB892_03945 [Listeria welshimeri]|nr:hypothetical protein [Listeria welshimeri]
MRKIIGKPVWIVGILLLVSSLLFLIGYAVGISYFRNSELDWIITTLVAGIITLIAAFINDYLEKKKARSKIR